MLSSTRCILSLLVFTYCLGESAQDESFYKFSAEDIKGKVVHFNSFKGKVVLVVNVATYCGFTSSTYPDLVKMQDILGNDQLFTVLGFPCNQFGEQEPDTNSEIQEFITEIYKVNFPVFNKIEVTGNKAHPLYKFLKKKTNASPTWNFFKYLVDHKGQVIKHWKPDVPLEEVFPVVEEAIATARSDSSKKDKQEL